MSAQFARAPHQGQGRTGQLSNPPHAALLIDFDNVTMGIRSDLTKELKNLLNSDIIKGKVAVQRAYADWRRYPQYIVPLAESSVDLIFAPAYGSAKKNATDIRLAIDALELVFVRPEIGTFILLSGDSDFSSLVLKLKEYGKYVIGVGIRESASDLLVQNCDEYYSYSALTGLTRAGEEAPAVSEDPWELVEVALRQMVENDDVMRSDRLKQVLLELDSNFDEKALGFTKFNKFLQEAANRGVLSLRKQENGQFEIAPADGVPEPAAEEEEQRTRRRRGGRGRKGREEREQAVAAAAAPEVIPAVAPGNGREAPAGVAEAVPVEAERAEPARAAAAPAKAEKPAAPSREADKKPARQPETERVAPVGNDLDAAFALLKRATQDAQRAVGGGVARDSDVKRRLLELDPTWDESNLGFSKFSRFLRRAHDEDVVTLRRLDNGNYEVAAGVVDVIDEPRGRRGRGRSSEGRSAAPAVREERAPAAAAPAEAGAKQEAGATAAKARETARAAAETPKQPAAQAAPAAAERAAEPAAPAVRKAEATEQPSMFEEATPVRAPRPPQPIGLRRGSRSRTGAPAGPPPLFEGQTLNVGSSAKAKPAEAPKQAGQAPRAAAQEAVPSAEQETPQWFPTEPEALVRHLSSYKGVGRKTAEQVVETFGAAGVYGALAGEQERVRELLGKRRADTLLEAFEAERSANGRAARAKPTSAGATAAADRGAAKQPARKSTSRSGARNSAAKKAAAKKAAAKKAAAKSTAGSAARKSTRKTARKSTSGGTSTSSK